MSLKNVENTMNAMKRQLCDEDLGADLCEYHFCRVENQTGYCSKDCMLGGGCDDSC